MGLFGKKKSGVSPKKEKKPEDVYVENLVVYKMPEKYLSANSKNVKSSGGGGGKKIFIVIAVVLILVIGGFVAYFLLVPQSKPVSTKDTGSPVAEKPPITKTPPTEEEKTPADNTDENAVPTDNNQIPPVPNPNIPENTTPPMEPPVDPNVITKPATPIDGVDSEMDGLTDKEETLYQTHIRKEDSDLDGFKDSEEVMNLYDPANPKTKLEDSSSVKKYSVTVLSRSLSLLYPSKWNVQLGENNVKFIDEAGDFIAVRIDSLNNSPSPEKTFSAWYATVPPISDPFESLRKFVLKDFEAYQSTDGLYVFLVKNNTVYIFNYDISATNVYYYRSTFKMMMNSFNASE